MAAGGLASLPGAASPAAAAPAKSAAEIQAGLEAAYAQLEVEYRALPGERFEPSAILEKVGTEDTALLSWVASETFWLPYQGLLKGAAGTLADRAGNSLDRALLLATLVEAAGYRVRLARAALTDEEARELLSRLPRPTPAALTGDCAPADPGAERRVAEHAADLEAALAGLLAEPSPLQDEILAAVRDHWWVERGAGEAWVALDPASPGKALREKADAHFGLPGAATRLTFPAHEITLAVIVEVWDAGKLVERPVVQTTLRPSELRGQRIVLLHHPMSGQSALEDPADLPRVKKTGLAEKEWLPVILADGRHIAKASFDDAGTIRDRPSLTPAGKVGAAVGGLFGGLGGDLSGEEKEAAQPSSVLTAEWVQVTIHSPGRPDRIVRREVFDLLGPAARAAAQPEKPKLAEEQRLQRALILAGSCEWLALSHHLSWAFVRKVLAKSQLDQRRTILGILTETDRARRRAMAGSLSDPGPLYWVATARRTLSPGRGETYLDAPNLLGFHVRFLIGADGKLAEQAILDLASCPVASYPGGRSSSAAVRQGVADGAAEDIALQDAPGSVGGTLDVLTAAKAQGLKLLALRAADDPAIAAMDLPPDTRARIARDLAAGHIVVLPEKPIQVAGRSRTGWWRVSPATGETVAVMDTGFHADTTEEGLMNDANTGGTVVRNRVHRGSSFWRRHPGQIARDMGQNPEDMHVLNTILDFQWQMFELGIL
jgi:hypothetical protein